MPLTVNGVLLGAVSNAVAVCGAIFDAGLAIGRMRAEAVKRDQKKMEGVFAADERAARARFIPGAWFQDQSTKPSMLEKACDILGVNRAFHSVKYDQINDDPRLVTSPVEGTVVHIGKIEKRGEILSKGGRRVYLENVLGEKASLFSGGFYINFYLSPRDKHYWRNPYEGIFIYTRMNEGQTRFPVLIGLERFFKNGDLFDLAVRYNASVASVLETKHFPIGMIAVGSLSVNSIHVLYQEDIQGKKGDLSGYFSMGSSMLLCFPEGDLSEMIDVGRRVFIGQPIVRIGEGLFAPIT